LAYGLSAFPLLAGLRADEFMTVIFSVYINFKKSLLWKQVALSECIFDTLKCCKTEYNRTLDISEVVLVFRGKTIR
jgi:hypothetical protein